MHDKNQFTEISQDLKGNTLEPYSSRSLTPKLRPPIDKIYIKYQKRISIDYLKPFRHKQTRYQAKRGYRIDEAYSGRFMFGNREITIHCGEGHSEIQFNPTQWQSLEGLQKFIELVRPPGDTGKINHLAVHVHLPLPLETVRKAFTVPRKIKTQTFKAETVTKRSGKISDVEFTGIYGANRTISIAIYDAFKKHRNLDYPPNTTRIEVRFHSIRHSPIKTLNQIGKIAGSEIFGDFQLLKPTQLPELKGRTKIYKELLYLYREKHGLKEAISRIGHLDPKHGHSVIKKITSLMKPYDVNLPDLFDTQMKKFISAPVSREEIDLIQRVKAMRDDHNASHKGSTEDGQ